MFRRWWFWAVAIFVVLIVPLGIGVAILGSNALAVRDNLQSVIPMASDLRTRALAADIQGAKQAQVGIAAKLDESTAIVTEPLWSVGEAVPLVGGNFTAIRQMVQATAGVVDDAVDPLIDIAGSIDTASFVPVNGAIDTAPITEAVPAIAAANDALLLALESVRGIDTSGTLEQVSSARSQLDSLLNEIASPLAALNAVAPILGPALGTEAPRTYAVMFQNNAEARALGGTALSFAVMNVDRGRIELKEVIPAGFSNFAQYPESVVPIPDGVEAVFPNGTYGTFIPNVTMRPSFVSAAETVQEFWRLQFGTEVDGVLSIDPTALSYLLRATGPLPISTGDVLTSENLVPLLLNDLYLRFDTGSDRRDNLAQDAVYEEAIETTFSALTAGTVDPVAMVAALSQGWDERRVLYWSAHREEQAQLEALGLNGELPVSDSSTDRFGVYFQDNVGSKMNYYLDQTVTVATTDCGPSAVQRHRVSVDLTNTILPEAVNELPISITGAFAREKLLPGVQRMFVLMYAPPGSEITGATSGGKAVALESLHDTDYPVGKLVVEVNPGETVSLSYDVTSGSAGSKAVEVQATPMVNPTMIAEEELECSTIAG